VLYTAKSAIKYVANQRLLRQNNALLNILPVSQHCPDQPFAHEHERCDSSPPFKHIRLHDLLWRVSKLQTFPSQAGWRSTALVLWDIPAPPHVAEHSVHTDHGDMTQSTRKQTTNADEIISTMSGYFLNLLEKRKVNNFSRWCSKPGFP